MRAVVYTKPGDLDVVEVRDVPDPVPGSDDILVDVAYAGLNRADLLQRQGRYGAFHTERPMIPGMEYAGTVAATGAHVSTLHEGDRDGSAVNREVVIQVEPTLVTATEVGSACC